MRFQTQFHSPTPNSSSQKPPQPTYFERQEKHSQFQLMWSEEERMHSNSLCALTIDTYLTLIQYHSLSNFLHTLTIGAYLRPQDRLLGYDHLWICSKHKNHSNSLLCTYLMLQVIPPSYDDNLLTRIYILLQSTGNAHTNPCFSLNPSKLLMICCSEPKRPLRWCTYSWQAMMRSS